MHIPVRTKDIGAASSLVARDTDTDFFGYLGAAHTSCKQTLTLSPYKADKANVLASSGLFTHPVDTKQHKHSFRVVFCPPDE